MKYVSTMSGCNVTYPYISWCGSKTTIIICSLFLNEYYTTILPKQVICLTWRFLYWFYIGRSLALFTLIGTMASSGESVHWNDILAIWFSLGVFCSYVHNYVTSYIFNPLWHQKLDKILNSIYLSTDYFRTRQTIFGNDMNTI